MAIQPSGTESSLSSWAGDYVTDFLGTGKALAKQPYQGFEGPLTAGTSNLQNKAFSGLAGLALPTTDMGGFKASSYTTPGVSTRYMNPYLQAVLEPQIAEATRQSDITAAKNRARMTQAGAYGGSRQAILEAENQRNLMRNLADITGKGYADAYDTGRDQFNKEQDVLIDTQNRTNQYGLDALKAIQNAGQEERSIESEGILADKLQFEEERDFPYNRIQWLQRILEGLPVASKTLSYVPEDPLSAGMGSMGGLMDILKTFNLLPQNEIPTSTDTEDTAEDSKMDKPYRFDTTLDTTATGGGT